MVNSRIYSATLAFVWLGGAGVDGSILKLMIYSVVSTAPENNALYGNALCGISISSDTFYGNVLVGDNFSMLVYSLVQTEGSKAIYNIYDIGLDREV